VKKLHLLVLFSFILVIVLAACGDTTPVASISSASPSSSGIVPGISLPAEPTATATTAPTLAPTATPTIAVIATSTPLPTDTPVPPTQTPVPTATTAPTATPEPTATTAPTPTPKPAPTKTPVPKPTAIPPTKAPTKVPATLPPSNPALSEIVRGKTGQKQVAITLDAGGDAVAFPKMIAALNKYGIKVTFFLTGTWAQQNPSYVSQIVSSGMEVANHSWSHPDFTTLSDEEIKDELNRTDALLSKYTGESTKPFMRFPYGARNAHTTALVNSMGYRSVYWTIDSLDSVGQPKTAQFLIDRITKQTDAQLDGEIVLMHLGNATSGDALPVILENLTSRGFKVVTISKLIGA